MVRSSHVALGVALAVVLPACADGQEPTVDGQDEASESLRIGRVHVVIEPESDDQLQITARFALVRGFDEEFGRARADLPVLARDVLKPGECTGDELGVSSDSDSSTDSDEDQALVLVDAGELNVHLRGETITVPLSLVPDLLPYMTGVEYLYYGDDIPESDGEPQTLTVEAEGSADASLPAFLVEGDVPADIDLRFTDEALTELGRGALVLRWAAADTSEPVALTLTAIEDGDTVGADITCLVGDAGQVRLDIGQLHKLGLASGADSLRVIASRQDESSFDAGDFVGSELVIERRSEVLVPLATAPRFDD